MPDGGVLTIDVSNCPLDEATSSRFVDVHPNDYVLISVTDTGIGASQDIVNQAFEPFFTTKDVGEGSGLDFSMVLALPNNRMAHVEMRSVAGDGTTASLFLPRSKAIAEANQEPPEIKIEKPKPHGHIAVVDDDPQVQRFVVRLLTGIGYSVYPFESGREILNNLAHNQPLDLLLTDIGLPGGMNGYQVAKALTEKYPDLKTVYMSGHPNQKASFENHQSNNSPTLGKPFAVEELTKTIMNELTD